MIWDVALNRQISLAPGDLQNLICLKVSAQRVQKCLKNIDLSRSSCISVKNLRFIVKIIWKMKNFNRTSEMKHLDISQSMLSPLVCKQIKIRNLDLKSRRPLGKSTPSVRLNSTVNLKKSLIDLRPWLKALELDKTPFGIRNLHNLSN